MSVCARVFRCVCWTEQVNAGWHMRITDLLEESRLAAQPSHTGIHGNHKNYISILSCRPEILGCWNAQIYCHYLAASYLTGLCFFCPLLLLFSVADSRFLWLSLPNRNSMLSTYYLSLPEWRSPPEIPYFHGHYFVTYFLHIFFLNLAWRVETLESFIKLK